MNQFRTCSAWAAAFVAAGLVAGLVAHETEFRGTVAKVEKARVQIDVFGEDGKSTGRLEWFAVTDKTKVTRGTAAVAFADARIRTGERIVIIVAHGDEARVEWTCPMHPDVVKAEAGQCPTCRMTLQERSALAKATAIRLAAR